MRAIILRMGLALAAVLAATSGAEAGTYTAVLRWVGTPNVAGYRVYASPVNGTGGTVRDVGRPRPAADGSIGAAIERLDGCIAYDFAVTAYDARGVESDFSNAIRFRYADVARAGGRCRARLRAERQAALRRAEVRP